MGASANTAGVVASAGGPLEIILATLESIPNSVWFDPAWAPGVTEVDDSGTQRFSVIQSRPIHTQYTISSAGTPLGPAVVLSPNNRKVMSFGGSHYLSGAAALATLLQGSALFSEVGLASRLDGSSRVRWGAARNAASPDDRVYSGYSGGVLATLRQRTAAGLTTQNTGSAVTVTAMHVWSGTYDSSAYAGWLDGAAETLAPGSANTRAPAVLNVLSVGCQIAGGTAASFWNGTMAGLILTPGHVLTTNQRTTLQTNLPKYYGY